MDRTDSRDYVRSALFVDFDNIYLSLKDRDPAAAEAFATDPKRWVDWVEEQLGPVGPRSDNATARVVLQRNCYMNPKYATYRSAFTRAGFRTIDCPPLTRQGKNSADIHIVVDALDVLSHATYYDEIVVFSLDADFTPLFHRLRAHDRRVVMLGSGPSAAAMRRSCDYVIPDDVFVSEALAVGPATASSGLSGAAALLVEAQVAVAVPPGLVPSTAQDPQDDAHLALRGGLHEALRRIVDQAPVPLSGAAVGTALRAQFGPVAVTSRWAGTGGFKPFVLGLDDDRVRWCSTQPGYVGDPARHVMPADDSDGWTGGEQGAPVHVVERATRILDLPRLRREQWRTVLDAVTVALDEPVDLPLAGRERLASDRSGALHWCTTYVTKALQRGDYDLSPGGHDAAGLATAFADSVVAEVEVAQLDLSPTDVTVLRDWLSGGRVAA